MSHNPYLKLVRPFTLFAAFLGGVILYYAFAHQIDFDMILLASIYVLLQAGGQSYNQAIDEEVQIDILNGKNRPTVTGEISLKEARIFGSFLLISAMILSGYTHDIIFVILVSIGAFLAWQYTDYPIRAKRFFIINNLWQSIARGFIPIITAFYLAAGTFTIDSIILSTIVMSWIFIFQTTKDFDDTYGDAKFNIHTFPVVIGKEKSIYLMIALSVIFFPTYAIYNVYFLVMALPSALIILSIGKKSSENNIGWKLYYLSLGLWFLLILLVA